MSRLTRAELADEPHATPKAAGRLAVPRLEPQQTMLPPPQHAGDHPGADGPGCSSSTSRTASSASQPPLGALEEAAERCLARAARRCLMKVNEMDQLCACELTLLRVRARTHAPPHKICWRWARYLRGKAKKLEVYAVPHVQPVRLRKHARRHTQTHTHTHTHKHRQRHRHALSGRELADTQTQA